MHIPHYEIVYSVRQLDVDVGGPCPFIVFTKEICCNRKNKIKILGGFQDNILVDLHLNFSVKDTGIRKQIQSLYIRQESRHLH